MDIHKKNHLLPIKFMIDIVGPVSLEKEYWYKPSLKNKTLENIEKLDIETAIKKEKITGVYENEFTYIYLMNLFLGKKYTNTELIKMVNDNKIIINNAKYQEMLKIVENAFPVKYISNNPIPLLCEYCGNDLTIGIAHYSYLKELYEQNNGEIELVYMRYGGHEQYHYNTPQGIESMKEMHKKILEFAKKYFTLD